MPTKTSRSLPAPTLEVDKFALGFMPSKVSPRCDTFWQRHSGREPGLLSVLWLPWHCCGCFKYLWLHDLCLALVCLLVRLCIEFFLALMVCKNCEVFASEVFLVSFAFPGAAKLASGPWLHILFISSPCLSGVSRCACVESVGRTFSFSILGHGHFVSCGVWLCGKGWGIIIMDIAPPNSCLMPLQRKEMKYLSTNFESAPKRLAGWQLRSERMGLSDRMFEASAARKTTKYSAVSVKQWFVHVRCNPWRAANDFFGHIKNRERPSPLPVSDTVFSPSICHRWRHTWFWLWLEHPASIPQPHFQLPTKSLARQQLSLLILVTGGFLSKNCSPLILAHSWLAGRDGSTDGSSFHYWEGALDLRIDQAFRICCIVFSDMSGGICGRCACRHPGGRGSNILRLWITCYVAASCRTVPQCQRWTCPWPEWVRSDGKNIHMRGAFMGLIIALRNHTCQVWETHVLL